jgi:hypothetical protein
MVSHWRQVLILKFTLLNIKGIAMKRFVRTMLIILLICFAADILTRLWEATHPITTYPEYLLLPSPAYHHAPYWSELFQKELKESLFSCQYNSGVSYHSHYVNFDNCRRRVVGQPKQAEHTLWLFGNSIIFAGEVPDEDTLASQLQALIPAWRVENVTTPAASVWVMLTMLEDQPVQTGDIVVFYSGVGDALVLYDAMQHRHPTNPAETLCGLLNVVRSTIYTFHTVCNWQLDYIPDSALSEAFLAPHLVYTIKHYKEGLDMARHEVEQHQAQFINILQPTIWSRALTSNDTVANDLELLMRPHVDRAFELAWPPLQPYADLDLTHVLDQARETEALYFDGWHINQTAITLVAHAIADALFDGKQSTSVK